MFTFGRLSNVHRLCSEDLPRLCLVFITSVFFSLCAVFGLPCQHASSAHACMLNLTAATYVLSSCWELNGDFLLQLAKDSKIYLLQGLESFFLATIGYFGVYFSI